MSKGLGRNKQGDDHDKIGTDVPRAGIKVAAGPTQGELPWKKIQPWKPKPKPTYMNKGGPVKKKKKGYNYGGMVTEGYGHGGMVEKGYTEARKKEPSGRLTDKDVSGGMTNAAYTKARQKQPSGRLTDRDVKRAGLK